MNSRIVLFFIIIFSTIIFSAAAQEQTQEESFDRDVMSYRPQYIPPQELIELLGVRVVGNIGILEWYSGKERHQVETRINSAANLIILSGTKDGLSYAQKILKAADIAPRQIEIAVTIIEINKTKSTKLGVDWDDIIRSIRPAITYNYRESETTDQDKRISRDFSSRATVSTSSETLRFLFQNGAGQYKSAPKILTLNNRKASLLDGQRVTYILNYSSYRESFQTDSMDAGLSLSVTPSTGESGYITLNIEAELTALESYYNNSSPVKNGQMIKNTVIVKDNESILIGGLKSTFQEKTKRRFPLLGHILPFLFSQETTENQEIESLIILTPKIIDFGNNIDDSIHEKIEALN